jgi:hypothetical protein
MANIEVFQIDQTFQNLFDYGSYLNFAQRAFQDQLIKGSLLTEFHNDVDMRIGSEAVIVLHKVETRFLFHSVRELPHNGDLIA